MNTWKTPFIFSPFSRAFFQTYVMWITFKVIDHQRSLALYPDAVHWTVKTDAHDLNSEGVWQLKGSSSHHLGRLVSTFANIIFKSWSGKQLFPSERGWFRFSILIITNKTTESHSLIHTKPKCLSLNLQRLCTTHYVKVCINTSVSHRCISWAILRYFL